jgi:beta-glucanase (GH16 family)
MEYYQGDVLANVAWLGQRRGQARWDTFKKPLREFGDNWSREFHVWRMDWDAESIKLFIDDQLLNSTDLKDTVNGDAEAANPFHEPHYMLINLAIGGRMGGDPAATEFPAKLEADYVRVYQK